jgi:hypothetical protein
LAENGRSEQAERVPKGTIPILIRLD